MLHLVTKPVVMDVIDQLLGTPTSILTAFMVLIVFFAFYISKRNSKSSIPLYVGIGDPKTRWMSDALNLLKEGYHKFGDQPFQVWTTEGYQVALPPQFVDEVKMLPDDKFESSLLDAMQSRHTTFGTPERDFYLGKTVKHDLNKNMAQIFPAVKEELDLALPTELPACDDWTSVTFYPIIMKIITRVTGRAFVGAPLNRNEEWIKTSVGYTRNVFEAAGVLRTWHPLLRGIVKYGVPAQQRIFRNNATAERLITPIIKDMEEQERTDGVVKRNDALAWVRDMLPDGEKDDYRFQAITALGYGAASIHTTSKMTANCVFDLVAYPEYIEILRDEVRTVLTASGGGFKLEDMPKLKRMDSFMKESQRHGGANIVSFPRKVKKPITLSDGTLLKPGTFLFVASNAISNDPAIYENPDDFDGLRYYKLRQRSAEDENKHQFVSTSKHMLHSGGGRHACPGRWFASHEMKLMLAAILVGYDLKLKDGEERPKNIQFQFQLLPDPTASILLRKRKA